MAARGFLQAHHILQQATSTCSTCSRVMTDIKSGRGEEKIRRCPDHKEKKVSFRVHSFLEYHNISLGDLILLAYLWSHEINVTIATELIGI